MSQNFQETLSALCSPDNQIRSQAEEQLSRDLSQPDTCVQCTRQLCQLMHSHPSAEMRSFAAIIFRRMVLRALNDDMPVWIRSELTIEIKQECRQAMLHALVTEKNRPTLKKVADAVAETVKCDSFNSDEGQLALANWPELMPTLFQLSHNSPQNEMHRQVAYQIFATCPASLINPGDNAAMTSLLQTFSAGLQDPTIDVQLSALKASVAFMLAEDLLDHRSRQPFAAELMVKMAQVMLVCHAPATRNEEALVEALSVFIELCELLPKLVNSILAQLVPFCVGILSDAESMDDRTRQSALELLLTLAENAPSMCRKLKLSTGQGFCDVLVPHVFAMLAEMEDDQDWYQVTDLDEDMEQDSNVIVGEQAMDRLSRSIGGKQLLPVVYPLLTALLSSSEWTERHAGMMCISAIGEGSSKLMKQDLDKLVEWIVKILMSDPHPRVRYAACNAIGQMCTDFSPSLQSKYHTLIVPSLCTIMEMSGQPRVQAHGAAALVNFCEGSAQSNILPYLPTLFNNLNVLVQAPQKYLQEQAITTLATVADAAGEKFVEYYPSVMPHLLQILQHAPAKEYRLLRGKTMECASLIALAVGKSLFSQHAEQFMALMIQTQQSITDADDPQSAYLLASWARVCKVLGRDFEPYMQYVMPPLLASARHRPDFAVLETDENAEDKGFTEEDGWEFIHMDNQQIGIKTAALEDKCTAVEMLICYAKEMGAGFSPYAEEVLHIVVPLLKFYFHEGVRYAAAAVIPYLFTSFIANNTDPVKVRKMWHETCSTLLMVIHEESDAEALVQLLSGFYEVMYVMGPNSISDAVMFPLVKKKEEVDGLQDLNTPLISYFSRAISGQINEMFSRVQQRAQQRIDHESYDNEIEESLQAQEDLEDSVLGELSRAIHIVFKTHAQVFMPCFNADLLPAVSGLLNTSQAMESSPTMGDQARQWSICVFDDLIEFCGADQAWSYRSHFWDGFLQGLLNQTSPDVRQAAAYGVGTLAWRMSASQTAFNSWYNVVVNDAMMALETSVTSQWAKDDAEQAIASENCVSAIGKIIHYVLLPAVQMNRIPQSLVNDAIGRWLQYLPIVEDEEEACHSYGFLVSLVRDQHPAIASNMQQVCKILVHVVAGEILFSSGTGDGWPEYGTGPVIGKSVIEVVKVLMPQCSVQVQAEIGQSLSVVQRKCLADHGFI